MTLPREGRLIRCYVQLAETGGEEDTFDDKEVSFEDVLSKAQKIFSPYKLESGECEWWSVYTVSSLYGCLTLRCSSIVSGGPSDSQNEQPTRSVCSLEFDEDECC